MAVFAKLPLLSETVDCPAFIVDFSPFPVDPPASTTLVEKIKKFSIVIFSSIAKSVILNVRLLGTSFKYTVLGFYGSGGFSGLPSDFYLIVFKIVLWAFKVGLCIITTFFRLVLENYQDKAAERVYLSRFAESEINTGHIQTKAIALDTSNVPPEVQVDDLLAIYDEINFSDPAKPGYMAPTSRQENRTTYTIEALKQSLEDSFIKNVKGRVAFLGTPPASDMPQLMNFYQQIEDAVRLSIHKSNQELRAFQAINGNNPENYQGDVLQKYSNILEDRARIAIDLAIAGKHCGARFMGDSMTVYTNMYSDGENISSDLTLQEYLFEILAAKRKEIAIGQIQMHLGADTHSYSNYMASFGKILALPGTQNVVEHLSNKLDADEYLELFFQEYTVEKSIIPAIQDAIKAPKAHRLREKITNWIQTQPGQWNEEAFGQKHERLCKKIESIKNENIIPDPLAIEPFNKINDLLEHLQNHAVNLPAIDSWPSFIEELFALDATKQWRDTTFSELNPLARQQMINQFKTSLSEEHLGNETVSKIQIALKNGGLIDLSLLQVELVIVKKASRIKTAFTQEEVSSPSIETIRRIITGDAPLDSTVKAHLENERGRALLEKLELGDLATNGLSPSIMEWLVVSQDILHPQRVQEG